MSSQMQVIKAFFLVRKKLGLAAFGRKAKAAARPTKSLLKNTRFRSNFDFGFELNEIVPNLQPEKVIIYLHGGGFVNAISTQHWQIIEQLAIESRALVLVPRYGLAPHHDVTEALDFVKQVFEHAKQSSLPISMVGDSAGGNLALSSVLHLGLSSEISRLVLISPWLASDFNHPELDQVQKHDPWLVPDSLRKIAAIWSGEDNHQDVRVAPLKAKIESLPKTLMFMGQWDLLLHDARAFYAKARSAGCAIDYRELPQALHVYPLLPTPEGQLARTQIVEFLR